MYYRPEGCGYTDKISRAGLFDQEYVDLHVKLYDEMSSIAVSELRESQIADIRYSHQLTSKIIEQIDLKVEE